MAPLPKKYKITEDKRGNQVYLNTKTNEIEEEHPLDRIYRRRYRRLKKGLPIEEELDEDSEQE